MEYKRIVNAQNLLDKFVLDAYLISSESNIFYLTGIDNFSREEREAYIFLTKNKAFLLTDDRYINGIKNLPSNIELVNISEMFKTIKKMKVKALGFENNLTYFEFQRISAKTKLKLKLADPLIELLRQTKDEYEIDLIQKACKITDKAFEFIRNEIKIGVSEKEIAEKMEDFIRKHGAQLSFATIVAFGENAAIPHHKTSAKKLTKKDEFVLIDFGIKSNNYCSDMTRTFLTKSATNRAKLVYQTVLESQKAAVEKIVKGEREIHTISISSNYQMRQNNFPDIPHGLGHGIGIDVHELPSLSPKNKNQITDGMTFTIEPGIYIPGFGGVRIEDDFLFRDGGISELTHFSKEMIVI